MMKDSQILVFIDTALYLLINLYDMGSLNYSILNIYRLGTLYAVTPKTVKLLLKMIDTNGV